MTWTECWPKDKPLLKKIITFVNKTSDSMLVVWTIATSLLTFVFFLVDYIYRIGFFSLVFHVPVEFLSSIDVSKIPILLFYAVIMVSIFVLYMPLMTKSYCEGKLVHFMMNTFFFFSLMWGILFLVPAVALSWHNISFDILPTLLFKYMEFTILRLILLYSLAIFTHFRVSDKSKLERQKNIILIKQRRREKSKNSKFAKNKKSAFWRNQELKHTDKKLKFEKELDSEQAKKDAEPKDIHLRHMASSLLLYILAGIIIIPWTGIIFAYQTTNFRLIDTDQAVFSQRIMDELDKMTENDEVISLVQLCQNEEHIMIAPCIYSESENEITIYTAYQHVMPVENTTFIHKSFQYTSIQ